jgi:peptidoglycan/LPS O-acetylase OafA/YrhL
VTYQPGLDGLRGVAILLVLGLHVLGRHVLPGGFIGVDVFFALSGYLITGLLLAEHERTGRIGLAAFYGRRIRRIWPALGVFILVVMAAMLALPPDDPLRLDTLLALAGGLTSSTNWLIAFDLTNGGAAGHLWSLAVEEQFYLLWPPLLMGLLALGQRQRVPLLLAALLAAVFLWRLHVYGADGPARVYNGLDTRADAILAGCLLASVGEGRFRAFAGRAWPLAAAGLFAVALNVSAGAPVMNVFGYPVVAGLAAVLIAAATAPTALQLLLSGRWIVGLGRLSYSLYLWHFPINRLLLATPLPDAPRWAAVVLLSLLVASLSYRLIEQPFLRRPHRLAPVAATAPA